MRKPMGRTLKSAGKTGGAKTKETAGSTLARASKTTHLSDKSTSRLSQNVKEMNKKVLQYIGNQ